MTSEYAVWLGFGISQLNVCIMIGPRNFMIRKKCSANNLCINLLISNAHGSSMYTLSILISQHLLNVWPYVKIVRRLVTDFMATSQVMNVTSEPGMIDHKLHS